MHPTGSRPPVLVPPTSTARRSPPPPRNSTTSSPRTSPSRSARRRTPRPVPSRANDSPPPFAAPCARPLRTRLGRRRTCWNRSTPINPRTSWRTPSRRRRRAGRRSARARWRRTSTPRGARCAGCCCVRPPGRSWTPRAPRGGPRGSSPPSGAATSATRHRSPGSPSPTRASRTPRRRSHRTAGLTAKIRTRAPPEDVAAARDRVATDVAAGPRPGPPRRR